MDGDWFARADRRSPTGRLRACRRLFALAAWTLISMPVQIVCLALPGRAKVRFARAYWRIFTRVLGVRLRVIGTVRRSDAGPTLFVSNHTSWVDIAVLGGVLPACFVAKGEIASWPFISWIAKLGRTVFVSRRRGATGRELDDMRARLARGDNLILFPEGTTDGGTRMRPFRSAFFAVAEGPTPPIVQPVSIAYDRLAGLPAGQLARAEVAWVGDQDIASHSWRLAQRTGLYVTVLLHPPIDPREYRNRKALSDAMWRVIADGASALYQHRLSSPTSPRPSSLPRAGKG